MKRTVWIASWAFALAMVSAFGAGAAEFSFAFPAVCDPSSASASVCSAAIPVDDEGRRPEFSVGDRVSVDFLGDRSFALEIVASPPAGIVGRSFIAEDAGGTASAVIKFVNGVLRITIDDFGNRRAYSVRVKDGVATISVRDMPGAVDDVCGTCMGERTAQPGETSADNGVKASSMRSLSLKSSASLRSSGGFLLAGQKSVIDVLVAFDRGAKAWAESSQWPGGDTIEEFADYAVDKMNYVLEKSQLLDLVCYRLVGVVEVDERYSEINENLLNALRFRNDAVFSPVDTAREKCGADTITLLVDRTQGNTSGKGYEYLSSFWSFEQFDSSGYTCNVCDIKTVDERYTMSHEQGHNLGCGHSDRQGSVAGPGCYPYSCGYHFVDAAGTNRYTVMAYAYTSPATGEYYPVPYFSTPDIEPEELGVAVGTPTNDNRQTIIRNYEGASAWREHVVPYDWDVRFVDDEGNDIPDGHYFVDTLYVTLTNSNPEADIYYTYDVSMPGPSSYRCRNGQRFTLYETKTITACAVTNGVAMSVRTVTFNAGQFWTGETGRAGSGAWADDAAVLAWDDPPHAYDTWTPVVFADLPNIASATVSVHGAISTSASFPARTTAYIFEKGTVDAGLCIGGACFAPSGDLAFNLPVELGAVAFTNPANHTIAFNAPFGQTVSATEGYCTNFIGIGAAGTLRVSPGAGKRQYFDTLNNVWFFSTARFSVGEGMVVFKGPAHSGNGVVGNVGIVVDKDGTLVFDCSGRIGGSYTSISGEGTVVCKSVATANSMSWTGSGWKGTVAFEGLVADTTTQNFQFEKYGNANSQILLRNCTIYYLKNDNNAKFLGTLVLDGDGALRLGNNGYSNNWNTFGALEGDGSISASSSHKQTYVFNTATNFTGSMTIGASGGTGRRIVFGSASASSDIPSQSATITVQTNATASIGGGATWNAYHGVEIAGTLIVKGANATLNCNASAAWGLRLLDGATLRFETNTASLVFARAPSFASGTNRIAFANGVAPTDGQVLATWPEGAAPDGEFVFADSAVAAKWALKKTSTGLEVEKAPVPAQVTVPIALRYWNEDSGKYEEKEFYFDLPALWVTNYYPLLDTAEVVAAKYNETAANGATVWQCYMLGLDPTDSESNISLSMTVVGNKIRFTVEGLGETHAIDGITAYWAMKTSTNLVTDAGFTTTRDTAIGLSPAFGEHPMPDKASAYATQTADKLFYKITVSFVAE